jgi:hypothetical protein
VADLRSSRRSLAIQSLMYGEQLRTLDAARFTGREEADDLNVDQRHFFQIQRHLRAARRDLLLDFAPDARPASDRSVESSC